MHLPRGAPATAQLHREWLRNLPRLTGKPLTRLAKEINVAPSTLTRPLKEGDDGTSTLHANTIAKVVAHTGVAAPADVAGPRPHSRPPSFGLGEDAAPYTPQQGDPLQAAIALLVGERNSVVPWVLRTRALELAGYLPGDVVLVDLNRTPQPGDAVCAQVYDWPRMKAETVMRVYERAAPIDLLVTRSLDPALQQPLVVDGERVIIKGVLLPHRLRPA